MTILSSIDSVADRVDGAVHTESITREQRYRIQEPFREMRNLVSSNSTISAVCAVVRLPCP